MPHQFIETEETLIIETPERVPLAFALASIGNRFLAVAIDHFIQYLVIILIAWFFLSLAGMGLSETGESADQLLREIPKWSVAILIIALFLVFSGYFIFLNGFGTAKRRANGF